MPRIYISYRRADSAAWAGRLYDRLVGHVGADNIFLDVSAIEPGIDFSSVIDDAVAGADALIVVIGPHWLETPDTLGRRRLDDSNDFVRREIAAALAASVRVIPVLVGGARMPSPRDLPAELAPLATLNALDLSLDWNGGTEQLASQLSWFDAAPAAPKATKSEPGRRSRGIGGLLRRLVPPRPDTEAATHPRGVVPDSPHDHAHAVSLVMDQVEFDAAADDLPAVALAMASVGRAGGDAIARRVDELRGASMGERAKALSLGFAIAEVVGVDVLGAAVDSLRDEIRPRSAAALPAQRGLELFYSYSHRDEELRDELEKHLTILRRQGVIRDWHDRKITAGTDWDGQIHERLEQSELILLLISSDFLASDYCYDVELERAMARHENGDARVVPIILRPVVWKGAPFGKLQALPTDARAVTQYANRDEAFMIITEGIAEAAAELQRAA